MTLIDAAAVERLRQTTVDWRFKGMPPDAADLTVAQLAGERRDLLEGGFGPSLLTLDRGALQHNIAEMAGWCDARGVRLAPHGKTTMAPQLWAEQLAHGAEGITVANVAQARVARAFGVGMIVIANEVVDAAGLHWIAEQLASDPTCRIVLWVDSSAGVALADAALASRPAGRSLEVLVEIGASGGRCGCRTLASAVEVAEAVSRSSRLRLSGVSGFEGVFAEGDVPAHLVAMTEGTAEVDRRGLFDPAGGEVVLSAGGSAYFDLVTDALSGVRLSAPTRVVLRSGCYVTHDDGSYAAATPAARGSVGTPEFRPALRLWSRVMSRPEPGLALLGFGRRDVGDDSELPIPLRRGRAAASWGDARVATLHDQHAYLPVPGESALDVGEWVGFGVSHPCTLFDKWPLIAVVDGTTVVDLVRTLF